MKKQICISGNCVTEAIPQFLQTNKTFNKLYSIKTLKPIFMLTDDDIDEFKKFVSQCDVFITMVISGEKYLKWGIDTESIKKIMKPTSSIICIPTPYFRGYFPEQFYLHDECNNLVGNCEGLKSPYHNRIILYGYINKLSPENTLKLLYSLNNINDISKITEESFNELQKREKDWAFKISDYIKQNYKKKRLFWSINHPTNTLIYYMSNKILNMLGVKRFKYFNSSVKNIKKEFLDGYKTPILPCVVNQLNLKKSIKYYKQNYRLKDIIDTYSYYDNHLNLVNLNKNEVENFININ